MAGFIKQLKNNDQTESYYPITLGSAVFLSNNNEKNVEQELNEKANLNSPNFIGTPTSTTPEVSDNSKKIATTEFVQNLLQTAGGGTEIILSTEQPESQSVGSFWYKEIV